ncbi:MAG TPA: trypsin-like peptidase domain-containing protein [Vicinamibacterales bacterium]|nr:trypsin-like peptidase domain-containing protein [Vicinamibacterales bacterium]
MTPTRRSTPFGITCVLSCAAFVLLSAPPAQAQASQQKPAPPSQDPFVRMNESIDALTKKVWPSVVQVLVSSYGPRDESGSGRGDANVVIGRQQATGSGFVIDPDGYIITNAHVVSGARRVQIVLPAENADGTLATALSGRTYLLSARIVGITTELDLALLKVDGQKLPALPLATYSQVRQGETVFAFGSPIGMRNSLTHGLVSAVARQIDPDSPQIFVQTDAPINPGNSGGPLVNIRGEVVGVNTFIVSQSGGNEGLGFAVPSATVRTVFRQLREYGVLRRQEVGMSIQTITAEMAKGLSLTRNYGVIVSDVWPGGPAEAAGLKIGDILISVDGQPADNLPTVNYNFRLRDSTEKVQIVVLRSGKEQTVSVTPVEQRNDLDSVSSLADPEKNLVPELGLLGVEINSQIAGNATGLRAPYGVIVVARAAGATTDVPLQPRDVIRSFNNRDISSLQSLRDAMRALAPGTPVTLQIQRDGRLMYVSFTVD